jgi:hypothetical protein
MNDYSIAQKGEVDVAGAQRNNYEYSHRPLPFSPRMGGLSAPETGKDTKMDLIMQHLQRMKSEANKQTNVIDQYGSSQSTRGFRCNRDLFYSPIFIAICTGLVAIMLMVLLNPPFVQGRVDNPIYKATTKPWKILLVGALTAIAVYILPILHRRVANYRHEKGL